MKTELCTLVTIVTDASFERRLIEDIERLAQVPVRQRLEPELRFLPPLGHHFLVRGHRLVHPVGQHHRQTRVDSQPPQVWHLLGLTDQVGEPPVGERQRVTAAENQFIDIRQLA